ncbi:hypothetical protein [Halochromatium roseum]|uniref:hypothetical protein n=1 Tax=Halochromatium roseum TaxID=391920 RepID=UPI001912CC6D|nr:hypothetical protein [Halochromatium roseum]
MLLDDWLGLPYRLTQAARDDVCIRPGYNSYRQPEAMARSVATLRCVLEEEGIPGLGPGFPAGTTREGGHPATSRPSLQRAHLTGLRSGCPASAKG